MGGEERVVRSSVVRQETEKMKRTKSIPHIRLVDFAIRPASVALVATVVAAVVSVPSTADTVAWWHLDEKAPGEAFESASATSPMSSTKVIDSCGNAIDGDILVVGGTGTGKWSIKPEVRPEPVLPFVGKKIYDPVGNTTNDNRSALHCTFASGAANNGTTYQAYYGGAVRIPGSNPSNPDVTQPTDAITVECFVCTTNTTVPNVFMPIVGKKRGNGWTSETWALYAKNTGKISLRLFTDKYTAAKILGHDTAPLGTHTVNDGVWHHVAFTYDKESGIAKVYVDYELDQTHQLTAGGSLFYDANASTPNLHALWIGGYPYSDSANGRVFNGFIDEVRISDAVLEPAQFLHLVSEGSDDEDVIFHFPFEGTSSIALTDGAVIAGAIGGPQAVYHATNTAAGVSLSYDTTEKAGGSVASGVFADSSVADGSSMRFTSANDGAAGYFLQAPKVTNRLYPTDSDLPTTNFNYTVECFAKAAHGDGQVRRTILKIGAGASYIPAHFVTGDANSSHKVEFCCALNATHDWTTLGKSPDDAPFDDGEWHHLALVSDATNKLVRIYYDYQLLATESNAYLPAPIDFGLYVGCKERGEGQFFDGWVDDIRMTKRVLTPEEFLTTHPVGSATQPLLTAMLEQNYEFTGTADSYWTVTGTGAARTGGTAPVFEQASRGALLLDGTNGTVSAANEWSAKMDRSNITFPVSPLYEQDAYTVEFWAKFDGYKNGADEVPADYKFSGKNHVGILRFVRSESTTFDWYLFRLADNPSGFQIAIRNANGTIEYKSFLLENRLVADGKWHHYAVQIARNADNTQCSVMLYADYEPLAFSSTAPKEPQTVAGIFKSATGHRLMVCESTSADYNILGNIDAVRFWRGTPDPSQFFGRKHAPFVMVLR